MSLANDANLLLIPSGYKAGKVYSQFPPSGDGDFTFSRTGEATRVNQAGLIETVSSNVPRLDYSSGKCPDLLLEPQRTNNILNSESLSNASWMKYNSGLGTAPIITDNYAISPSGEMNASRLQMSLGGGTTSSDRVFVRQLLTSQTNYYFSVYLKSTNGAEQKLNWHFGSDDFLITVTDEWQRFELDRNSTARTWAGLGLRGNLVSTLGIDDSVDILVYGFQVEQGANPTSIIPTSGSTVTRNADLCNNAGNSNVFNDSEGVIYAELSKDGINPTHYSGLSLSNGGYSERIEIRYVPNSNTIQYVVRVGGSAVVILSHTITNIENKHKIAVQFKKDDFALWVNGTKVGTDTSGDVPSGLSEFAFDDGGGVNVFTGNVYNIRVYNNLLSDTELQELTTL